MSGMVLIVFMIIVLVLLAITLMAIEKDHISSP